MSHLPVPPPAGDAAAGAAHRLDGGDWWRGVRLQETGPIIRHALLTAAAPDEESRRSRFRREDLACTAGLRNPARIVARQPHLIAGTRALTAALVQARLASANLQSLHLAGGSTPSRQPPTEECVDRARQDFAAALGVSAAGAAATHPASPWRYQLFGALAARLGDTDAAVPRWLEEGAPMGLAVPIDIGGHFPLQTGVPPKTLQELEPMVDSDINHGSFGKRHGDEPEAAGLALVRKALNDGFGELYETRAAAEHSLGGRVFPAPLGTVTKTKADGSLKHRLIQDLKVNEVNLAVGLPERLVLPRPVDLAVDLAELHAATGPEGQLAVGIIDFADAFMSVPLRPEERRYNCAEVPAGLRRDRPPLHASEPQSGQLVVWRVLGFGGRPNPLVFGRLTASLMRAGQAMLSSRADWEASAGAGGAGSGTGHFVSAKVRLQLYVDDAAGIFSGARGDVIEAFDLLLLLWLVLGAPISWSKVALEQLDKGPCRWIGVDFDTAGAGARMRLPSQFLEDLAAQVRDLASRPGRVSDTEAQQLCGRAARVAFVVPTAVPFAAALRAALQDARGTPGRQHAAVRFAVAARWFLALLAELPIIDGEQVHLERLIFAGGPPVLRAGFCEAIVFDASPWGGGAVKFLGKRPVEYFTCDFTEELCSELGTVRGESAHLTFYEALVVLATLEVWYPAGGARGVAVVGDNVGALTVAVSRRGRGDLGKVCREVALRQARSGLHVAAGHLPSSLNTWADALSRLTAPRPAAAPASWKPAEVPIEIRHLPRRSLPPISQLFRIEPPRATVEERGPAA